MNKFNTWAEETAVRLQESIPVKKKIFFRPFGLLFGLKIRGSAARAPSLDPQLYGHVTSRHVTVMC